MRGGNRIASNTTNRTFPRIKCYFAIYFFIVGKKLIVHFPKKSIFYKRKAGVLNGRTISNLWRRCIRFRKSSLPCGLQGSSIEVWHLCDERKWFLWRISWATLSTIANVNLVSITHGWLVARCKEKTDTSWVIQVDVLCFRNSEFYCFDGVRRRHRTGFDAP